VVNALEPEWEARFEPKSYGFRPGRGCHDAIESIFKTLAGKSVRRPWILDADLAAAFDRIEHSHLLSALDGFPARELIAGWLKAGVIDDGRLAPTEERTPKRWGDDSPNAMDNQGSERGGLARGCCVGW
jgi:RNA-directed DNA polymerase